MSTRERRKISTSDLNVIINYLDFYCTVVLMFPGWICSFEGISIFFFKNSIFFQNHMICVKKIYLYLLWKKNCNSVSFQVSIVTMITSDKKDHAVVWWVFNVLFLYARKSKSYLVVNVCKQVFFSLKWGFFSIIHTFGVSRLQKWKYSSVSDSSVCLCIQISQMHNFKTNWSCSFSAKTW